MAGHITSVRDALAFGALGPLKGLLDEDEVASPDSDRIFTRAGLEEIESLAINYNLVCRAAVLAIQKAAEDQKLESGADANDKNSLVEEKIDYTTDLLVRPMPDLSSLKTLGLVSKLRDKHCKGWLEQRLEPLGDQLFWISRILLVHLQIAKLARLSLRQTAVAFDDQLVARTGVYLLWNAHIGCTKKRAREQEKTGRMQKLRSEQDKSDAASVRSSSAAPSVSTAVNSEAPESIKKPSDVDDTMPQPPSPGSVVPYTVTRPTPVNQPSNDGQGPRGGLLSIPAKLKAPKKTESSLDGMGKRISNIMADWAHCIFGRDDEFENDYESTELEAYVAYGLNIQVPMRVPFGHRRLQYGLKQARKQKNRKAKTTFNHFVDSGVYMHRIVDDVVREANRMQKCERTLIIYRPFPSFSIFFFSIQPEKQPIAFKDAFGRDHSLPFELCKKWEDMKVTIEEAFHRQIVIGFQLGTEMRVRQGYYDLVKSSTNEFILPGLWEATIKPGDSIIMTMRLPLPIPPFSMFENPRNGAEHRARSERFRRIMANPHPQPMRPAQPPNPAGRPVLPSAWLGPPPPQPPHMSIAPRRVSSTIHSSDSSEWSARDDGDKMTADERTQLTFVNYVAELEKVKTVTLTDLLSKFTNLKDVSSDFLEDIDLGGYSSDDSSSDAISTLSIVD